MEMKLKPIQWFDALSFVVEVKGGTLVRHQLNVERKHHVKLDTDILNHRPAGRLAGLHRNRGYGGGNRQSSLRALSGALPGVVNPGREESLNATTLNKGNNMKSKLIIAMLLALGMAITARPAHAAHADDARIVSAAKNSYVYRTYLKDDDIKIEAKDGLVTLEGEVAQPSHKNMAEDTVGGLPGVKKVENRLEVKSSSGDEKSDGWLEVKVKSALLYHRNVSGTKTEVSVKDGQVTLRGTAANSAQKELTGQYAKDIEGVKEVVNEMKVTEERQSRTMTEVIDDASITAQVKAALLTQRSTSALHTSVTTRGGVVILSGQARNPAEKDLVTKVVSDIHGVKSVVNKMDAKD
jgi:hyperosmotically inducible protein